MFIILYHGNDDKQHIPKGGLLSHKTFIDNFSLYIFFLLNQEQRTASKEKSRSQLGWYLKSK